MPWCFRYGDGPIKSGQGAENLPVVNLHDLKDVPLGRIYYAIIHGGAGGGVLMPLGWNESQR